MPAVNEIISSSNWFRTPISRTAAYITDLSKESKDKETIYGLSSGFPASKWYHHIFNKSRGQAIGGAIGVGFLGWFIYDLVTRWGEGGFWKRTGLLIGSLAGDMISLKTKPAQNIFNVDLITSGLLKIAENYNDEDKFAQVKENFQQSEEEIKRLCGGLLGDPGKYFDYMKPLELSLNKILEPLGMTLSFKLSKNHKLVCSICINETFEHKKSNPDVNYNPFIIIPDLPVEESIRRINNLSREYSSKGETPELSIFDMRNIELALKTTSTGYLLKATDTGVEIPIQKRQSLQEIRNYSGKYIGKRLRRTRQKVSVPETNEDPAEDKRKFNVVG